MQNTRPLQVTRDRNIRGRRPKIQSGGTGGTRDWGEHGVFDLRSWT